MLASILFDYICMVLQSDIGSFKQIQLHEAFIYILCPYDCTITIIHFHILQVMNVMHTCLSEVKEDDTITHRLHGVYTHSNTCFVMRSSLPQVLY